MTLIRLAAALMFVGIPCIVALQAQSTSAKDPADTSASEPRRFEVASVKPGLSPADLAQAERALMQGGGLQRATPLFFGIRTFPGGRFSASMVTLRGLIARAYSVKDYQISGGPSWAASDYFTIEARASGDATDAEFNEMLKSLLVERFGLRAHMEARQGKVYALTLARNDRRFGSGLKQTSEQCLQQMDERKKNPPPQPATPAAPRPQVLTWSPTDPAECGNYRIMGSSGSTTIAFSGQPMSALIDHISGEVAAPVVNRTALDGMYDVLVEYESRRYSVAARAGLDPNSTESPKLPLPNALERQLGLKLESTTGDIPTVVVDAAEKPTPD